MASKVRPTAYTKTQGGDWHPWRGGKVHVDALGTLRAKAPKDYVLVAGVAVHSLHFTTLPNWDCVNGWRD